MRRFSRLFCLWSTMIQRYIIMDEVGVKGCMPWCVRGFMLPRPRSIFGRSAAVGAHRRPVWNRLYGAKGTCAFNFCCLHLNSALTAFVRSIYFNPWSHVHVLHEDKTGCKNSVVRICNFFFSFHLSWAPVTTFSMCLTHKPGSHKWVPHPFLLRFLPSIYSARRVQRSLP
ncbi:unnamed protein product, partial [Ectocarpus sp. 8 AP-2014]